MTARGKTREQIAAAYSFPSWWYDLRGLFILTFAHNCTLAMQVRFFAQNLGPNHLEAACGSGALLELVLRWRRWKKLVPVAVTAVDYAPSMLAGARRRFAECAGVTVEHADVVQLPFSDRSFDSVGIANAIHCFPDVGGALRDIHRVLKPGGTLTLNALLYPAGIRPLRWAAQRIMDWGMRKGLLCSPFDEEEIRRTVQVAGFEISREFRSGNTWNAVARKPDGGSASI